MTPSLTLHLHDDWDTLADDAATILSAPRADPFAVPLLVTSSTAHSRALGQAVARRCGVAAGLQGMSPAGLRAHLEEAVLGVDAEADRWSGEALTLRILDVIDSPRLAGDPDLEPVRQHLAHSADRGVPRPAWTTARRAGSALEALVRQNPALLARWRRGERVDSSGAPLGADRAWWAAVWQGLHEEHPDEADVDPVERLDLTCQRLTADQVTWPSVLWLTGPVTQQADVQLVAALSRHVPVTVMHVDREVAGFQTFGLARAATTATWRQTVDEVGGEVVDRRTGRRPTAALSLHECHGPDRQAEVVADVICHSLAEMPDSEPRDVVVLCPAGSEQAELLVAMSRPHDPTSTSLPKPISRCRVAGRPAGGTGNPVADVVVRVLRMPGSRQGAGDLLDLCAMPAVAQRFDLSPDDLGELRRLVVDAGIRWGLDAADRARNGVDGVRQSTWLAGVDRMLLGIAMSVDPPSHIGTITPVDDIGTTTIPLVGAVAELVSRLRRALLLCAEPATVSQWADRVATLVDDLAAAPASMSWAVPATLGMLTGLQSSATGRLLDSREVADLLESLAARRPGRPSWFNGSCQVCSPAELDTIAHDVVILVEPDRTEPSTDLLRGLRAPGDPRDDPGALSRQYLADAVAAARHRLVVVRGGLDPVTNAPVLPGPFVSALVASGATRVVHGLQPFSPAEFPPGPAPWRSVDAVNAVARSTPQPRPRLLPPPADPPSPQYAPADIAAALTNPARTVLRARMGAPAAARHDEVDEALPLVLDPLAGFAVRQRLLDDLEHGADAQQAAIAERLRASTPPGELGRGPLYEQLAEAESIAATAAGLRGEAPTRVVDVDLNLVDGMLPPLRWPDGALIDPQRPLRLIGRILSTGPVLVRSGASRVNGRAILAAWVDLLAAAACDPAPDLWRAVLVSRSGTLQLVAPDPTTSTQLLAGLLRAAWWSSQQLLPMTASLAAVMTGLVTPWVPRGSSPAEQQWGQDHDANWAPFIGPTLTDLEAACRDLDTTPQDLADWLMGPVVEATGRQVQP